MLDVIISKYATECEIKNISFSFDVCVTNLKYVKSNDLVTILSNALDNAIEAAEKSSSKTINIATDHINTYDVVTITNSCDTPQTYSATRQNAPCIRSHSSRQRQTASSERNCQLLW